MNKKYGTLYGVGVGPGAPDLLTLRAVDIIRNADIICIPQEDKNSCRAYQIAEEAVPEISEKECVCFDFKMTRDEEELRRIHADAYRRIKNLLTGGRTAAFLMIGDPSVYSSFSYIAKLAVDDQAKEAEAKKTEAKEADVKTIEGIEAEDGCDASDTRIKVINVSGISSYHEIAARLGISLCEGDEELHIGTGNGNIEELLALPGTKVIMKCGKITGVIRECLRNIGKYRNITVYGVADCGLHDEKVYYGVEELPDSSDYMTTIIVKEN